jgi:hypothetical protein
MIAHGVASVLIYDTELVMRVDTLPRPVNYSLLRVIPPAGVAVDEPRRDIAAALALCVITSAASGP